jgi:hypothetical protein
MVEDNSETLIPKSNLSYVINLAVNGTSNEKININSIIKVIPVNTYGLSSPTLKDQLLQPKIKDNNELIGELMRCCKIIDYVDCVHDFKSCNLSIERILGINGINLCSASLNINIDKSHALQEELIKYMVSLLQKNGVIIPILENSFFLPKEQIGQYILSKKVPSKFYLESGRTPDVPEQLIQPKTICAIYDGCAHSGISYAQAMNPTFIAQYKTYYQGQVNVNIEDYEILFYGNLVRAIFKPSTMDLIVQINGTEDFINIRLINNVGITVNSILSSFPNLNNLFQNAERGSGNDEENFIIVATNLKPTDPKYVFLATCLKTVCDKIVSTELTPNSYIGDIATVDGYVWAGVTYKYIIGDYPILPTIYESVKNGWNIKPGIYDINTEISDRIIRLVHLYVIFNGGVLPPFFNGFVINPGIINSYVNLFKNYYEVGILSKRILENIKVVDNIFDFLSCIKILFNYGKINEKIQDLKHKLILFNGNPNVNTLLQIPLLEDVLKNNGIEDAMNNQQTVIYSSDVVYNIVLNPEQQIFIDEFMNTYKNNIGNPTSFIPININEIIDQNGNCNKPAVSNYLKTYNPQEIDVVCDDFNNALIISQRSSQTQSTTPIGFNFFTALRDELINVSIKEELSQITFILNQSLVKGYSKKLGLTVSEVKEWFTNSVYELNDDDDIVYVVNKTNFTITGPLEMEILWILSIAIFTRPLLGSSRMQQAELQKRLQIISNYGKILFSYLKPDYFNDDSYLSNFVTLYIESIKLIGNQGTRNTTYLELWKHNGLPLNLPGFSSELPDGIINEEQLQTTLMRVPFIDNRSLPGDIRIEGGSLKKRSKTRKLAKKTKKTKTRTIQKRKRNIKK